MQGSSSERILIVEDDESIRYGLGKVLKAQGYQVDAVGDATEAIEMLGTRMPNLVILDFIMPETDGLALCELMRHDMGLKEIKIILLTGYLTKDIITKAVQAGADKYIAKPVENKNLIEAVRTLLV
jgi:CheY-like chemotaxis protein